jgi:hypothetical protein
MKVTLPNHLPALADQSGLITLLNGGKAQLCTAAPTLSGGGILVGATFSANFPVSAALTWAPGGTPITPQTLGVAAAISFVLGSPPSVAEVITGVYLTNTGAGGVIYVAFDRPITVGAGYGYANLALRLLQQYDVITQAFSDQSTVAFLQV